jgi:sugar phosphate isomerase/epimerase
MTSAIHPRVSVNGVSSMTWTLEQDIEFWQRTGIRRVGVPMRKLLAMGIERAIDALNDGGIAVEDVSSTPAFRLADRESWDASREALSQAVDVARRLAAPVLYTTTGPPGRLSSDAAVVAFVEAIAPVSAYAESQGVRLAVEQSSALSRDSGCVHTWRDVTELIEAADLGLCLELQNCWFELHLDQQLARVADRLCLVQVSDAVPGTAQRFDRAVPGDGDLPLDWWISALLQVGYEGVFELEFLGPRIEQEGYGQAIARGVAHLSRLLYEAAA